MDAQQVEESKRISANRIIVERTIGRIREFLLIRNKNEWPTKALLDDIMIIVCALVNLGPELYLW